jgi:hypothetical protein
MTWFTSPFSLHSKPRKCTCVARVNEARVRGQSSIVEDRSVPEARSIGKRKLFMIRLVLLCLTFSLLSCSKTVYEPAETEHGGLFVHGTPTQPSNP